MLESDGRIEMVCSMLLRFRLLTSPLGSNEGYNMPRKIDVPKKNEIDCLMLLFSYLSSARSSNAGHTSLLIPALHHDFEI